VAPVTLAVLNVMVPPSHTGLLLVGAGVARAAFIVMDFVAVAVQLPLPTV
jgi:hypothetical protein